MHFPRLKSGSRAIPAFAAAIAFLVAAPAALAETTDSASDESSIADSLLDQYSLTDETSDLQLDEANLIGHPTNYRHRHRRRRVTRRAAPTRGPRKRSFGDDRSSIYIGIGGMANFFIEGNRDVTKVYKGGGGFDLMFGARFSKFFALELNYFLAFQSTDRSTATLQQITDATLQGFTVDGKIFIIPSSARIEPYLQLGIGAFMLSETFREQLSGIGFDLGFGVDVRLSRNFALGARAQWRGFYVDNSSNNYYAVATESAFLNTISGEAYVQFHF